MTTSIAKRKNGNGFPSLRTNLTNLFDIEDLFNDSLFSKGLQLEGIQFGKLPATNIKENDKEYIIELAAPGLEKKDFQVEITNNTLEIKVEKENTNEEKGEQFMRREYSYNAFCRSFDLPESVNADIIDANYKDGILNIHIPKLAEEPKKTTKKITII